MRPERERVAITAVGIVVLVATAAGIVAVDDVRTERELAAQRADVAEVVESRQAPTDWDGDGVPDGEDACPTRAETENGVEDGDGCPDVVATTGAS